MKKRAVSTFILVLVCIILASPGLMALVVQPKTSLQQTAIKKIMVSLSTISIDGTVYGLPLNGTGAVTVEGASVTLIGGKIIGGITFAFQKADKTNANGYYFFTDVPIGLFLVIARKPDEYLPGFRFVRLTSSQPVKHNQDITMIRKGGGGGSSESMNEYMLTLAADEQLLLQQYMDTLSVEEQILMQQSMSMMLTNG
ncbi:MAG: carboxypeptidase-like regulatory domain-containing protein [Candidatus Thermoplasmatota archaeon]|jgi:hypothetical protein|nr:carboxypeptidase-like regulatory domain-containing protein [Candidatus Thermoplasmatota archaeon]